ncbi:hypothetical protein DFJ74DRAFT_710927 [Hyaloraphidium curvatum]|nr:hypothetical protein DFJ74DRAFT_710927 [Hyaloraphidium curvatum]
MEGFRRASSPGLPVERQLSEQVPVDRRHSLPADVMLAGGNGLGGSSLGGSSLGGPIWPVQQQHAGTPSGPRTVGSPPSQRTSPSPPILSMGYWDDERLQLYLLHVNNTVVARRTDNSFINGTKLLNLAGLTRGRRDGALKNEVEKQASIVRTGNMNVKGVWIPLHRAKAIAERFGLNHLLEPLLSDNPAEHLSTDPATSYFNLATTNRAWTGETPLSEPNSSFSEAFSADDSEMNGTDDYLEPINPIDRDVARALAEFRNMTSAGDRSNMTSPGDRSEATGKARNQVRDWSSDQITGSTPVLWRYPAAGPIGASADGSVPPYVWLVVPANEVERARATFNSDAAMEQMRGGDYNLEAIPIYALLSSTSQGQGNGSGTR